MRNLNMKTFWNFSTVLVVFLLICQTSCSAPVEADKKPEESDFGKDPDSAINDLGLEYGRYLQEVVSALEEDKEFAKKLENVSADHIKSGAIASELNLVNHNIRNKLDELKRIEIERLRKLTKLEHDYKEFGSQANDGRRWRTLGSPGADKLDKNLHQFAEHLNHANPNSFEVEDLHKLIIKATRDLEVLDKKRREEFKRYEMEKEYQYREGLKNMTDDQRKEAVKKHDEMNQKHKEHPRVHHPGSKQQLEEVWEEQDHMPKEEFNPKTFFALHDVNGDGYLDPEEVEALLSLEIKKMYDPNNPEDDPNEMEEEYHRMREHVYKEADKNKDGLISQKEFIELTQKAEFERDEGWKGIDEQPMFNEDELRQYEARRQELLAQQYGYYMPPYQPYGHDQPPPGHYQPGPGMGHPQQQPPQQHFGNVPPYQVAQGGHPGYQQQAPPHVYQPPPQFAVHPGAQHTNQYQQGYPNNQQPNQYPPPPPPQQQHQPYQAPAQIQNQHYGVAPPANVHPAGIAGNQGAPPPPPQMNRQTNSFGQPNQPNQFNSGQQNQANIPIHSSSGQQQQQQQQQPQIHSAIPTQNQNQHPNSINSNQGSLNVNSNPQQPNPSAFNQQPPSQSTIHKS